MGAPVVPGKVAVPRETQSGEPCGEPSAALGPRDCRSKLGVERLRPAMSRPPLCLPLLFPLPFPLSQVVLGPVSMGQDGFGAPMALPLASVHSGCGLIIHCQVDLSTSSGSAVMIRSLVVMPSGRS